VRIGHSCAAVSSYNSSPEKTEFFRRKSINPRVGEGWRRGCLPAEDKLGVRIPGCGFSLRVVARRLRKSFIVKWRVRNIKIDTEKIKPPRVPGIHADEFSSVEKALIQPDISARALDKINRKTKPPGSLGMLETLAVRLAELQQTLEPKLRRKRICVYAGCHGVTAEGVSAYPSEVTDQMVLNFLSGGAAINVLARHGGIQIHVVDAGVDGDWPAELLRQPNFFQRGVRRGTRNFYQEPAMTAAECEQAIEIGREQVRLAVEAGIHVLGIGEMGIGNTTTASALLVALLGFDAEKAVGRGTGISDAVLRRKVKVVAEAVKKHSAQATEPCGRYWLQTIGGYEIAAMTGTILEAARVRMPLVVDGFIATAAAAAAFDIDPTCRRACFFSHRSDEQAHGTTLKALRVEPILDLKMRLGEGTGAALAMHLLEASARILCEMATFDSAGISGAIDAQG
jgi:nicotinate-nucleotide--dimethylbenzimidazole phosphoribosyltransferase